MSDLRTAAKEALWAFQYHVEQTWPTDRSTVAIAALRAALAQQDEPVQEPVAWLYEEGADSTLHWNKPPLYGTPLYTAPPQRQPLTEEEILKAIGWERAEMYMKLATNFPVDEAKQETLKNARAVERAVWEKNHG